MTLAELVVDVPMLVRVLVGLLGGLLVVAGARWLRVGLGLAAFGVGAAGVGSALAALAPTLPAAAGPSVAIPAALLGGAALLMAARLVERVAMLVAGGFTGLVVGVALASWVGAPAWLALVGALAGALLFPWLWERLLRVVTAVAGAGMVAWAVGMPDHLGLIGGLAVFGVVVQFTAGRDADRDDDDDEDDA